MNYIVINVFLNSIIRVHAHKVDKVQVSNDRLLLRTICSYYTSVAKQISEKLFLPNILDAHFSHCMYTNQDQQVLKKLSNDLLDRIDYKLKPTTEYNILLTCLVYVNIS